MLSTSSNCLSEKLWCLSLPDHHDIKLSDIKTVSVGNFQIPIQLYHNNLTIKWSSVIFYGITIDFSSSSINYSLYSTLPLFCDPNTMEEHPTQLRTSGKQSGGHGN